MRMERSRRWFVSALATAGAAGVCGTARACGFDGAFDAGFGSIYPRAIEIALAVRRAVADGLLPHDALDPLTPGPAGLWQATEVLKHLGQCLSAAREARLQSSDIALLCSDASLWTRYAGNAQGFDTLVHVDKPALTDVVAITELAIVASLVEGRLPVQSALARGLLVVEASGDGTDAFIALLSTGCGKSSRGAVGLTSRTPWGISRLR
jgi:hypothetical protein